MWQHGKDRKIREGYKNAGAKGAEKKSELFKARRDEQVILSNLLYHKSDWKILKEKSKAQPTAQTFFKVTWSVYQPFNSNLILLRNESVPSNCSSISFSVTSFSLQFLPGKGEKDTKETKLRYFYSSWSSGPPGQLQGEASWGTSDLRKHLPSLERRRSFPGSLINTCMCINIAVHRKERVVRVIRLHQHMRKGSSQTVHELCPASSTAVPITALTPGSISNCAVRISNPL